VNLKTPNEMEELMNLIIEQSQKAQVDFNKMVSKGNIAAAKRARAALLEIEKKSKELRKKIQEHRATL
jgi:hypothetical protein